MGDERIAGPRRQFHLPAGQRLAVEAAEAHNGLEAGSGRCLGLRDRGQQEKRKGKTFHREDSGKRWGNGRQRRQSGGDYSRGLRGAFMNSRS